MLLGQVALVLGLQVDAPRHRELELLLRALEDADRLRVVHARELGVDDARELGDDALLDALLEERHVVAALVEHGLEDVLQQGFGEVGVVGELREGDLGLDHPELGQVPARVGVLGAKRGPERVDLRQREAIGLDVELPRHGEKRLAPEEVLREVDLALRGAWQVRKIERRDAEERARAFRIGGGDDRRVDPQEPLLVEEAVDRLGDRCRTRVSAPMTFVRGRRCATSRRNSSECGFGWIGYVSGSSTQPTTRTVSACISKGWPLAGDGTILPVASTAQPAVRCITSLA